MHSLYRVTLIRLALLLSLGLLVGYQFGSLSLGVALAMAVYIAIMLFNFGRFREWLIAGGTAELPVANTFWTTIMGQIRRLIRQRDDDMAKLQSDVEFFKDSFQALDSAVVVINERGEISWANAAAGRHLRVTLANDYGQLLTDLLRAPKFIKYLHKADFTEPLVLPAPTNPERTLEIQATPFRDKNVLLFARDISEIEKLETIRRDFVANVSHELRTPLTVITGYLETLIDYQNQMPETWQRALEQMLSQAQRMDNMVSDLIWLSRLETLPEGSQTEHIPLSGLFHGIIEEVRITAPRKVINLHVDEAGLSSTGLPDSTDRISSASARSVGDGEQGISGLVCIAGNYDELRAAFANLLQNALKYTAADGHIDVTCARQRDSFSVTVKDNGVGIDPVHLPRLTERFYRVDDSRTSSTGGTGLGLAIVKHVLKRHEAELRITSQPGKGSSFSCVFPLSRISLHSPEQVSSS